MDARERYDYHRRRSVHEPDPAHTLGNLYVECVLGNARPGHVRKKEIPCHGSQISRSESELNFMGTQTAALPRPVAPISAGVWLPAFTLWWREIVRFYRQKTRVVGVLASPLVFWIVIGSGFGTSFRSGAGPGQQNYLDYFYPGALIMIVLFTSIFAMMSLIEDRKEGFLLSVMAAPVPRSAIVLGKVLGGTTLAGIQGLIFLAFAPFVGVHMGVIDFLLVVFVVFLVSFALTSLGFAIAWPMDSTQAFHAIINLFLIPLWLLSGALFPLAGGSGWLRW